MSNRRDKFETKNAIQSGRRHQGKAQALAEHGIWVDGDASDAAGSCHPSDVKRILCLWFPNWPIQRLVVQQPELRRKRVVLFRRDSRRGQVVSAVSPLAMQNGVCVDMPLSEAKSLLRSSGGFHVFEHDRDADLEAMEALADSLESFSPIVGLETIEAADFKRGRRPDSVFLEVTGLSHLFGDENQLARKSFLHCETLGYLPRIAIGDTVGMAWGAARFFAGAYFRELSEPLVLPSGDPDVVKPFPVEALRIEPTVTDTLYQLGIETVGQLQRLSRNDLAMRFGNAIHKRLDQMLGSVEEPVAARRKPAQFMADQLLEFPTHHRDTIEVIIARLVTEICAQMRARQRGALEWTVKLVCQTGSPIEFRVNLFQPTATTKQVMPLVEMQLEQVLSPHTRKYKKRKRKQYRKKTEAPVQPHAQSASSNRQTSGNKATAKKAAAEKATAGNTAAEDPSTSSTIRVEPDVLRYTTIQVQEIMVSVTSEVLLVQQQRQLFDENPRLDRQALAQLINRLASRLGTENVVYPMLQSGAQPEYSFRFRPLVDSSRNRRRRTKPPKLSHQLARPLRLFHPAQPLEAVSLHRDPGSQGSLPSKREPIQTSPPALLCWGSDSSGSQSKPQKAIQRVIQSWGPERIETGWWRGLTVCRDYWRVETESQQHYWIYRDLRSGRWFLHGEF